MKKLTLTLLLLAAAFASCTQEDTTDCSPIGGENEGGRKTAIRYEYTLNKEYTDLFGPNVKRMAIYLFDQDKLFHDSVIIDEPELLEDNHLIHLPLEPGQYTLVSCGGYMDTYSIGSLQKSIGLPVISELVKGTTTLNDFCVKAQLATDSSKKAVATNELHDLYWGSIADLVVPEGTESVEKIIPLVKNSNTIKVNITGIAIAQPDDIDVHCTGFNGQYAWDNKFHANGYQLKYMADRVKTSGGEVEAEMKILRLVKDYDPDKPTILTVKNQATGETICNINIIDELLRLKDGSGNPIYKTQEDLDREDTYTFTIHLNSDLSVAIRVNGWVTEVIDKPFI